MVLCLPSSGGAAQDGQGRAEILAGGGAQAWSGTAGCEMCRDAAVRDPRLPQNHPAAPAGPVTPWLISPLATFGLDFPLLAFPYKTS